jgi:hypothetical protein
MLEGSLETNVESHIFETKNLCKCVYAGTEDDGVGQEGATKKEEKDQQRDCR